MPDTHDEARAAKKIPVIREYLAEEFPGCEIPEHDRGDDKIDYVFRICPPKERAYALQVAEQVLIDLHPSTDQLLDRLRREKVAEQLRQSPARSFTWGY